MLVNDGIRTCSPNVTTQLATSTVVTRSGRACTSPPKTVFTWRCVRRPSATQSGHWNPTAALTMQSGQIGLSQRAQRMYVCRSGCR